MLRTGTSRVSQELQRFCKDQNRKYNIGLTYQKRVCREYAPILKVGVPCYGYAVPACGWGPADSQGVTVWDTGTVQLHQLLLPVTRYSSYPIASRRRTSRCQLRNIIDVPK